jgi:hypothetical protein
MTELGEKTVEAAKKNGTWDAPKENPITEKQYRSVRGKVGQHTFCLR